MRALAVGLAFALLLACEATTPGRETVAARSAVDVLRGDDAPGFARALAPRPFAFPADHGPHPAFRSEWWYTTGNLADASGRRFGFELTFFRQALAAESPPRASAWATRDLALAHFAVTDVEEKRFHAFERRARIAAGLAGAEAAPFGVWLDDWRLRATGPDAFPARLVAREEGVAVELELSSRKPPVLHGDGGLSHKGGNAGNASYYLSMTRLEATGEVALGDRRFAVAGSAWLDHEWSTSVLPPEVAGWDWIALQLDDGRELMVYQLRRRDGSADPASHGTSVAVDGEPTPLAAGAFSVEVLARWRSPRGPVYPARWRVAVPGEGLAVEVVPRLADQELDLGFRYWEGAVAATGTRDGKPLSGVGYVELVGYGDAEGAECRKRSTKRRSSTHTSS